MIVNQAEWAAGTLQSGLPTTLQDTAQAAAEEEFDGAEGRRCLGARLDAQELLQDKRIAPFGSPDSDRWAP